MSESFDKPEAPAVASPAEPGHAERRTSLRFPFTAAAEVFEQGSQTSVTGRCSDLSLGGCYVDTMSPIVAGSKVRVQIKRESDEFEAGAVVSYAHPSMGMGLAFTEVGPESKGLLRKWIAELSGEKPSSPGPTTTGLSANSPGRSDHVPQALMELINLLARKKILGEDEAAEILRRLSP